MKHKILILGCGNIGTRYLQGLKQCKNLLEIYVVDKNIKSLKTAKNEYDKTKHEDKNHCFYSEGFPKKIKSIEICIVATSSYQRFNIINNITKNVKIKNWIFEKVLAQNSLDLKKINNLIINSNSRAWVNTSGRSQPWLKKIRSKINQKILLGKVDGYNWGLMCNSIHYLDLFSWWTKEKLV